MECERDRGDSIKRFNVFLVMGARFWGFSDRLAVMIRPWLYSTLIITIMEFVNVSLGTHLCVSRVSCR
jgi:hypothetical protein